MTSINRLFTVDGKPFFPVGAQARNSSSYNEAEWETAFQAVKLIHGNTLEIPVYWDQIEPAEGRFDFTPVDGLLAAARRHGIRLVLLWFGTWKNGDMDYAPGWVKTDPGRFHRVISAAGCDAWVLSSHCPVNREADSRAFAALCGHLKQADAAQRTVVGIQVENEPGILGSDRDHGPDGQADFERPVPAGLVERMAAAGQGHIYDLWQAAGGRAAGTWAELFGWAGGEVMTAWSIATYIDAVAAAGQAVYDVPMYVNVWVGEGGWAVPGETYPSGGAIGKTLDIHKWCTPHIGLIAPDIYQADAAGYEAQCRTYARPDNALFVPESGLGGSNTWNLFRAVAEYNAIGYAFFGAEHLVAEDGSLRPELADFAASMRCLAGAVPLLLRYQGTGQLHAVVQEENLGEQRLDLGNYIGLAQFGDGLGYTVPKDWRHPAQHMQPDTQPAGRRGRGLIVEAGPHEFYVTGAAFRLVLRRKLPPALALDAPQAKDFLLLRQAHYVTVDEGHFAGDNDGSFVIDRRRNGDEVDGGVWVEADTGVVRVVMCD